ncbi:MAG: OmpH family outer membrane protein [Gammaproteobacteria bacterium]|nr:OmpH family outer membrane protein [Gammaproteobacteria bacterium]MDH4313565.1 OmpH family outer membrane protein [Gammaproteobacteria bacterium]MDH5212634.1 OmpH family outer membrane protein [Gammaproteobacteria bacterium]MDH5501187.1 OmpH family outer membrane protein [Gammaproteobacteria bacterium]
MNFAKRTTFSAVLAVALMLTGGVPAMAQQLKIGVVNVPALMQRAPQGAVAMEALEEEFRPRQREVLAKQQEFEALSEKVQRDVAVMGETERRNAEKELRDLQREVARLQNEFQEDLNLRRNEELGNLQRALLKEVQDYASSQGFDLVVGDGVLYASSAVNITESVLKAMEANFQAAGN